MTSPRVKSGLLACATAVLAAGSLPLPAAAAPQRTPTSAPATTRSAVPTPTPTSTRSAAPTPGSEGRAGDARVAAPVQIRLPVPTGPYSLGTVSLHLVDRSRPEHWVDSHPSRELMVSLTYPARKVAKYPISPWISPKAGAALLREQGVPAGAVLLPQTHAHEGAPADRRRGRLPVVLYSPGNNAWRAANTVVVEELASRGYAVVTMDHTYDGVVEFPDGRVVTPVPDGPTTGSVISKQRVADTRFVLDELAALNAGGNPDAEHRRLPEGLRGLLDLNRVGMFGHSAGGPTVASAMYEDRRIKAGLSLDGPVAGPVVTAGLDRPYMLMDATKALREKIPDLETFWKNLKGWKLDIRGEGVAHGSYTDDEIITSQAGPALGLTQEELAELIGTLDPKRAVAIQRAYPRAFFDLHLRHRGHLLDAPSPRFPEVKFIP